MPSSIHPTLGYDDDDDDFLVRPALFLFCTALGPTFW